MRKIGSEIILFTQYPKENKTRRCAAGLLNKAVSKEKIRSLMRFLKR